MLPTQLDAIRIRLEETQQAGTALNGEQKELSAELSYLDENNNISQELKKWNSIRPLPESYTVATGTCPVCGKKY
jgi:hypothetical protein